MSDPVQAAIREVPILVYDFLDNPPEGLLAGFYFNLPMPDDDKVNPAELFLDGPYASRALALDAAREFIQDALFNHKEGIEE